MAPLATEGLGVVRDRGGTRPGVGLLPGLARELEAAIAHAVEQYSAGERQDVSYTPYIVAVIAWLQRNGVRVREHALELPAAGMYRSETREIFLNEPRAFDALMTVAHEAGHWLGYLIDEKLHPYQRERQAYVYGWHVLRWFDAPIGRETWRWHCRANELARRLPNKQPTEHLYR